MEMGEILQIYASNNYYFDKQTTLLERTNVIKKLWLFMQRLFTFHFLEEIRSSLLNSQGVCTVTLIKEIIICSCFRNKQNKISEA